ncbi:MAG: hypothetical protein DRI48_07480 [Chloroflexi bacterium]|nr:MAG: hypothetical protein DRI48_07480 [Chloroflexota bacterium]
MILCHEILKLLSGVLSFQRCQQYPQTVFAFDVQFFPIKGELEPGICYVKNPRRDTVQVNTRPIHRQENIEWAQFLEREEELCQFPDQFIPIRPLPPFRCSQTGNDDPCAVV